jgi:type VI secretion system protein ImpA
MSVIDINALLSEVSAESPCGEDLEYDPAYGELERNAQGTPEQTIGDSVVGGEPPDWRAVRDQATELLRRSKDLRIVVYLLRALARTDGMNGLSDGLALIRGLLERYWDDVHPQLDPEDNNDPTLRVNIITTLCDRDALVNNVREAPLSNSRALGRFGLYDILVANGAVSAPEGEAESVPNMATIDAAFMDTELEELQATSDAVTRSNGDLAAIDGILMEKVGSAQAPDLSALSSLLKEVQVVLNDQLARRGAGNATLAGDGAGEAGTQGIAAARSVSGEITTREDAIRMMDKISDYFQRNEPSSPVPLLMQRAKRLVSKNFMDILRDMAPDGVPQAENIGGIHDE